MKTAGMEIIQSQTCTADAALVFGKLVGTIQRTGFHIIKP